MRILATLSAAVLVLALSPAFAAEMGPAKTETTSLGTVLANDKGMTLYTFKHDAKDKSSCLGKCATNWPPFMASADAKPSGEWSIVTRPDHARQWAYKDKPLYTWSKDEKPGDTKGNGFLKGAWEAARP